MQILFLCGWFLILLAFGAAASEPFVVVTNSSRGFTSHVLTSAYDLWYAMAPGNLVLSKIKIVSISPVLWDPLLVGLLQLPGWLIAGGPGLALAWLCRPNRLMSFDVEEEYERQKESLFIVDTLTENAKSDETWDPNEDDRSPVHLLFDLDQSDDEDIRNSQFKGDLPAGVPTADDLINFTETPEHLDINQLYEDIKQAEKETK